MKASEARARYKTPQECELESILISIKSNAEDNLDILEVIKHPQTSIQLEALGYTLTHMIPLKRYKVSSKWGFPKRTLVTIMGTRISWKDPTDATI